MLMSSDGYLEVLWEFKDTTPSFILKVVYQFVYLSLFFNS